jgi:hypothetical protein
VSSFLPLWKEALVVLMLACLFSRASIRRSTKSSDVLLKLVVGVTITQLVAYALLPIASFGNSELGSWTARLAGLRQGVVPILLLVLGMGLRRVGYDPRSLIVLVLRYGTVLAVIAIVGLVFSPLEFWAHIKELNAGPGEFGSTTMERLNGMQSYFFGLALPRAVAPFASPLALAFTLILPIALLWSRRARYRPRHQAFIILLALALSQTRGVILAFLLLAGIRWLGRSSLRWRAVVLLVAVFLLTIGPLRTAILNTATGEDPSSRVHWLAVVEGISRLRNNPTGVGLGEGGQIGRTLGQQLAGGESLFLVVGNERGWLGLTLIVLLFGVLYRRAYRIRQSALDRDELWLADGVCLAIPIVVFASLVTEHGIAFLSSWLFWITAGFVCAAIPTIQVPDGQGPAVTADEPDWTEEHRSCESV